MRFGSQLKILLAVVCLGGRAMAAPQADAAMDGPATWVLASLESQENEPGEPLIVTVRLNAPPRQLIRPNVQAVVKQPDGSEQRIEVLPVSTSLFASAFMETAQPGRYEVRAEVKALDQNGHVIEAAGEPVVYFAQPRAREIPVTEATPAPAPSPLPVAPATPGPVFRATPMPVSSPASMPPIVIQTTASQPAIAVPPRKMFSTWDIAGMGLILVVNIGFGLFFWSRLRRTHQVELSLEERLAQATQLLQNRIKSPEVAVAEPPSAGEEPSEPVEAQPVEAPEPEVQAEESRDEAPDDFPQEPIAEEIAASPPENDESPLDGLEEELEAEDPVPSELFVPDTALDDEIAALREEDAPQEPEALDDAEDLDTQFDLEDEMDPLMSSLDMTPEELAEALQENSESERF